MGAFEDSIKKSQKKKDADEARRIASLDPKSDEAQRRRHVSRAKKAGLGPLIKKNLDKMDDSYSGSNPSYLRDQKEEALSEQVIKGYFSGNLRSKKRIADEQDMATDEQNAAFNYYREPAARRLAHLQDTAKPQRIQVTPGKWIAASNLKGK